MVSFLTPPKQSWSALKVLEVPKTEPPVFMGDTRLVNSNNMTYLGVNLNKRLSIHMLTSRCYPLVSNRPQYLYVYSLLDRYLLLKSSNLRLNILGLCQCSVFFIRLGRNNALSNNLEPSGRASEKGLFYRRKRIPSFFRLPCESPFFAIPALSHLVVYFIMWRDLFLQRLPLCHGRGDLASRFLGMLILVQLE